MSIPTPEQARKAAKSRRQSTLDKHEDELAKRRKLQESIMVPSSEDKTERKLSDRITLNVGGQRFATTRATLVMRYPESFLGRMFAVDARVPAAAEPDGSYFIDRSGAMFEQVLEILRSPCDPKTFPRPKKFDKSHWELELQFYGLLPPQLPPPKPDSDTEEERYLVRYRKNLEPQVKAYISALAREFAARIQRSALFKKEFDSLPRKAGTSLTMRLTETPDMAAEIDGAKQNMVRELGKLKTSEAKEDVKRKYNRLRHALTTEFQCKEVLLYIERPPKSHSKVVILVPDLEDPKKKTEASRDHYVLKLTVTYDYFEEKQVNA